MDHFLFFTITLCTLVYSTTFLRLTDGADDILFPNQTIGIGQTLICRSQVFELGFFRPGTSSRSSYFLGIWYKSTPDIVVWVANRNNPIHSTDHDSHQGVLFGITRNGTLAITRAEGTIIIWSSAVAISNPILQLLDTGNLVAAEAGGSSYIWQSFDNPTDTLLPGMKMVDDIDAGVETYLTSWKTIDDPSPGDFVFRIQNQGLPELVILFRGKMKMFRTSFQDGLYFNSKFKPELVFKEERLVSISRLYDDSIILRATLDTSGSLQRYKLNAISGNWHNVHTYPRDHCDIYSQCGPFGICRIDTAERCECFKGFSPKSPNDWDLYDWSGGCTRNLPLDCEGGDGFVEVIGVKYPDMLRFLLNASISLSECRDECLKNCSCTAYANAYITSGGSSGCLMWFGDLIDTRELSSADHKQNIYIRIPFSELDFSSNSEEEEKKKRPTKLILLSIAFGVVFSGFNNGGILLMTRRNRQAAAAKRNNNEDLELPMFKMATIVAATNNFSTENMIGEGGFGLVYKGRLSGGEEIAVKRLSRTSKQGLEEFKNEVMLIAKLQHRNLVRLLGCCIDGEEKMLIYEYMQNKSLDYFIFDQNQRMLLTWPMRFDIIMGIARGLLYLHQDSRLKIIHRDLKTSNILLDRNLNPKISDFGLARIFEEVESIARTKRIVGTYGYMSPEYAIDGKYSVKSDIFSLGVVLMEIICGKKNRGFEHYEHYHSLLGHAWLLWKETKSLELMDECMHDTFIESQVQRCIHVSLLCVQKFAQDRPIMSSVLFMLGADGVVLPEPNEPGFFITKSQPSFNK